MCEAPECSWKNMTRLMKQRSVLTCRYRIIPSYEQQPRSLVEINAFVHCPIFQNLLHSGRTLMFASAVNEMERAKVQAFPDACKWSVSKTRCIYGQAHCNAVRGEHILHEAT